ncbi:ERI1 exoribonuclease 3 isoform X1 [Cygnus atratus]|uniref:ERI1 exoribonuclease 3 isoform X1 n=2 Tax=Cygnus atratus TaxID=8868 RepID=UPI0015D5FB11|nr:ERI1 exoribonuclease 3 isoform X1 [Cygnus atratus]XP_050568286.1 ERI1 exoribonuclease 3 isoform X1 [Cygnus atratus]
MIALLHTGAAKFPQNLLPRARQAVCSLLPPGVLKGYGSIVSRKLASHGFGASMAAMSSFPPQRYHYFLVLDFEATCDKPQIHPQEIIEFPILKLNGRTMEIESTFHMYVQPVVHPQLTPFCTELTGIIQGMVDGQPSLQQVLERVDEWMAKEGLLDPSVKSIFVTCGDWDLKVMLPGQCQYLGLPVADYFKQWINLKKVSLLELFQAARGLDLSWGLDEEGCRSVTARIFLLHAERWENEAPFSPKEEVGCLQEELEVAVSSGDVQRTCGQAEAPSGPLEDFSRDVGRNRHGTSILFYSF